MKIQYVLLLLLFLVTKPGFGLNYNSPALLEKGDLSVASSVYIDDNAYYGILLNSDYGFSSYFNPVVKIGYQHSGRGDIYLGLEGKILLAERFGGTDYFTIYLGGHYYNEIAGIDFSISIGNIVNVMDNYIGFDFDFEFIDEEIEYPCDFIMGIKFKPFDNDNSIVIEGGIPVTSYSSYKLGVSMRFIL